MKTFLMLFSLFLLPVIANAQFLGSRNDPFSGNSYNWNRIVEPTNTSGYNSNAGSSWNPSFDQSGPIRRGTDSHGNYWNYNSVTGPYYNFGSGRSCYGTGALKNCY